MEIRMMVSVVRVTVQERSLVIHALPGQTPHLLYEVASVEIVY